MVLFGPKMCQTFFLTRVEKSIYCKRIHTAAERHNSLACPVLAVWVGPSCFWGGFYLTTAAVSGPLFTQPATSLSQGKKAGSYEDTMVSVYKREHSTGNDVT